MKNGRTDIWGRQDRHGIRNLVGAKAQKFGGKCSFVGNNDPEIEQEMEMSEPRKYQFVASALSLNLSNRSLSAALPAGVSGNDDDR